MKQRHINLLTAEPADVKKILRHLDSFFGKNNFYAKGVPLLIDLGDEPFEYVLSHDVFCTKKPYWFVADERFALGGFLSADYFGVRAMACYSKDSNDMLEGLITANVPDEILYMMSVNFNDLTAPAACYLAANIQMLSAKRKEFYFSCNEQMSLVHDGYRHARQITLNLTLSHHLVPRQSSKTPDQDRYAIIKSTVGKGQFSTVSDNSETLRVINGRFHKTSRLRVKHEGLAKTKERIQAQDSLLSRLSFLKSKPTMIVTESNGKVKAIRFERRMPGKSFEDWLQTGVNTWSLDLRCRLAIASLRSVKTQVHDNNIIHMDIKPGNLMFLIDEVANPEVNIIDYNLSRDRKTADEFFNMVGTSLYYAPEAWENAPPVEARDIFALGVMLGQLFGATLDYIKIQEKAIEISKNYQFIGLFTDLEDTPEAIKGEITAILMSMVAPNAADRPGLSALADRFEAVLAKINLAELEAALAKINFAELPFFEDEESPANYFRL